MLVYLIATQKLHHTKNHGVSLPNSKWLGLQSPNLPRYPSSGVWKKTDTMEQRNRRHDETLSIFWAADMMLGPFDLGFNGQKRASQYAAEACAVGW